MDIQDYDLEVDDLEEERPSGRGRKTSKGITAALVLLISILVVLLLIAGALIMAYFTGKYAVVTEDANGELPVYTETQVRDMITEAEEVADKLRADEVEAAGVQAKAQGYALGRNDLLDFIKNTLLSTNSSIETFRLLYPNNIVVVSNSAYHFIEINRSLKLSELVQDRIKVLENGEIQYTDESGNVISHKGIDVSEYQGNINWSKVAADGVEFAIVRTHYRGYGTGRLVEDSLASQNISGAMAAGVKVGAYVFSQAITAEEAVEEADAAIETLSPYTKNVPIVMDVERVAGKNPRMDALSPTERTDVILAFCQRVKDAGYIPMLYFNTEMGSLYIENERLEEIPKWYAWYSESLYFPYKYDIWQYKDTGKVDGIGGNVDMNISLEPLW
ncbi:MAG: glycoside hydrolase family 25 protein [Lachnospiraceae bacterium]|nr:glycoside hydrolase family 25 protein [Lachnospiraceae bacterium]